MDNDTIKNLGLCPVCQKGHIIKGSLGYSCNYFKNMNDKCTFNIYHSYWGKEITEEVRIDNEVLHNKVIDTDLPEVIRQYKEFSDKLATGKVYYDAEEAVYRVL